MNPRIRRLNSTGLKKAPLAIFLVAAAACVIVASKDRIFKPSDGLYHGSKVNSAVEEREDPWWKDAQAAVQQKHELLGAAAYVPKYPTFFHGSRQLKEVALTFDDGPHPGKVEKLLPILDGLKLKATFFIVGKMAERHPELVKMEADAGHEIADHTFSHVNLSQVPEEDAETEYLACKNLIHQITGKNPEFCRPPGGRVTQSVMEGASRCGLVTTMWSDDPKDYSNPGTAQIESDLLAHVSNGGILLLHEGVIETMQILPDIVANLRREGYKIVTVGQLWRDTAKLGKPTGLSAATAY